MVINSIKTFLCEPSSVRPINNAALAFVVMVVFIVLNLLNYEWSVLSSRENIMRYSRHLAPINISVLLDSSEPDLQRRFMSYTFPAYLKGIEPHRDCRHSFYKQYARRRMINLFDDFAPALGYMCPSIENSRSKLIIIIISIDGDQKHDLPQTLEKTLNTELNVTQYTFKVIQSADNSTEAVVYALDWAHTECSQASLVVVWDRNENDEFEYARAWGKITDAWTKHSGVVFCDVPSYGGMRCKDKARSPVVSSDNLADFHDYPCTEDAFYCPAIYWLNRPALTQVLEVSGRVATLPGHARHVGFCLEVYGEQYTVLTM